MRVIFARPAARDLDAIADYIAGDNPKAAESVYRSILAAVERLADFPDIGRPGRLPATRELSITGLPYIVAYRVAADHVTILAVLHGARDISKALSERRGAMDD